MRVLFLLVCLFACAACTAAPAIAPDKSGAVDYSCREDSDCAVKDIGNCCGRYPACVNRDSPVFPEQVKAECQRKGMLGVCGFPVIAGCQCQQGRCVDLHQSTE